VGLGLSPKYVLDEMEYYEIDSLLDSYYLKHKDSWEQARFVAYMTAQVNSRNTIQPEDILKFSWEKDETTTPTISIEEQQLIEQEIKQFEDILNNKA
jgi:hypothetical protein